MNTMAQLNITLNQDEILQLLANDRDFAFKKLLQDSLNSILKVPKHRDGEAFKTFVFDNYCRSEAALIVTMAEMCVNGISTRMKNQFDFNDLMQFGIFIMALLPFVYLISQ